MYWQVYFHPVSRSAEVILRKILQRAKYLANNGYQFAYPVTPFHSFFQGEVRLADYINLDESVILYYFQVWQTEQDDILSDLCQRFINRRLFKYIEFSPMQVTEWHALYKAFRSANIDPDYYLELDSSSDLPYDFYRPGEEENRLPIQLLMASGELRELSRESTVVEAISGKKRTDHKLYFPLDMIEALPDERQKQQIMQLLYHNR